MPKAIPPRYNEVVCIGAGASGICLGVQLRRKYGFTDIHFYDRNENPSGTWEANRYPGCACDVPAIYYSFSFATKPDWNSLFPTNVEMREYFNNVIDRYGLRPKMTLRTEVDFACWDGDRKLWVVYLRDLESEQTYTHECRILFSAVGILVDPVYPKIAGMNTFNGPIFHTGRWREDVDLKGKDIIVVGNGSSGIQTVPKLIPMAKSVTQIIKTPHWLLEVPNYKIPGILKSLMANIPYFTQFVRAILFSTFEKDWRMFIMDKKGAKLREASENVSREMVKRYAPPEYYDLLIPDWPISCKRRIFDHDGNYLKSLKAPNYKLTKESILEILPNGLRTDKQTYNADAIIFATGYETSTSLSRLRIQGRNDELLTDHWRKIGGPGAYSNTSIHGFPNFMMLIGPNSVTGHNSVIFTIESQVRYSLKIIEPVLSGEALTFEVKEEAERNYVRTIQNASQGRVWNSCHNWYVTNGWNATIYPWSQVYLWWKCHRPEWKDWTYAYTPRHAGSKRDWRLTYLLPGLCAGFAAAVATYMSGRLEQVTS